MKPFASLGIGGTITFKGYTAIPIKDWDAQPKPPKPFRTARQVIDFIVAGLSTLIGFRSIPRGFAPAPVPRRPRPAGFFVVSWLIRKRWKVRRVDPLLMRQLGRTLPAFA